MDRHPLHQSVVHQYRCFWGIKYYGQQTVRGSQCPSGWDLKDYLMLKMDSCVGEIENKSERRHLEKLVIPIIALVCIFKVTYVYVYLLYCFISLTELSTITNFTVPKFCCRSKSNAPHQTKNGLEKEFSQQTLVAAMLSHCECWKCSGTIPVVGRSKYCFSSCQVW